MTVLTPGFLLAGLLLAAIPLVIHFLNRRRFREQPWAAMSFLLAAVRKNRRRLRFEQWLLLTVRCLLLALLGLALARPVACGSGPLAGLARSSGLHVFILDDSYSMGYAGQPSADAAASPSDRPPGATGATHFERQRALARAVLGQLVSGGDAVAVVAAGRPARVIVPRTYDLEAAASAIDTLELRAVPTDLAAAVKLADELAGGGAGPGGAGDGPSSAGGSARTMVGGDAVVHTLRIFSDGTRSSLGVPGSDRNEGLRRAMESAGKRFQRIVYHHLGTAEQATAAVLSVGLSSDSNTPAPRPDGRTTGRRDAEGRNSGSATGGSDGGPREGGAEPVGGSAGDPIDPGLVTLRGPGTTLLAATVGGFGFSGRPAERVVQWRVDDTVVSGGVSAVRLTEGIDRVLSPGVRLTSPGWRVLETRLVGDDPLAVHTTRWRVLEVVERVRVLLVEGERGSGPLGSSGAFLRLAMSPAVGGPGDAANAFSSPLAVDSIGDLELASTPLSDYRVVVLIGVSQLNEAEAEAIARFVESGGVLVVFAGEGMSLDAYNRVLLPRGLLPGPLVRRVSAADAQPFRFDFDPRGNVHPMLSVLRGEERSGLDAAEVFVYVRVDAAALRGSSDQDAQAEGSARNQRRRVVPERVLSFRGAERGDGAGGEAGGDSDLAISTHTLGAGRVVFVATSAGADGWNTLPARPVFVTLVQEMIGRSLRPRDGFLNLRVGDRLRLVVGGQVPPGQPTLTLANAPTLTDPAGQPVLLEHRPADDASSGPALWQSVPLTRPGIYRLTGVLTPELRSEAAAALPVAVNVDAAAEADVRTLTRETVRALLTGSRGETGGDASPPGRGSLADRVEVLGDELPAGPATAAERGADFGWAVLLLLLGLVLFEGLLAWRFGHSRS
ncbi:MAG: BatA domain-containing protein, partial [Tepidisphaerales bacterium]